MTEKRNPPAGGREASEGDLKLGSSSISSVDTPRQPTIQDTAALGGLVPLETLGRSIVARLNKADDMTTSARQELVEFRNRIKSGEAGRISFVAALKKYCVGLHKTRAYQLLAIEDGRTTEEKENEKNAARQAEHKAKLKEAAEKLSVSNGNSGKPSDTGSHDAGSPPSSAAEADNEEPEDETEDETQTQTLWDQIFADMPTLRFKIDGGLCSIDEIDEHWARMGQDATAIPEHEWKAIVAAADALAAWVAKGKKARAAATTKPVLHS